LKQKTKHLTISRFTAWINKPRAVVGQSIPTAKRVNPSKVKFIDAVTCSETSVPEFSNLLDQSCQAWCHFWLSPLLINEWGVQLYYYKDIIETDKAAEA
jgi:hypothetical protein